LKGSDKEMNDKEKDQTEPQKKDEALLRVNALLGELRDKYNIRSFCVLVIASGPDDDKVREWVSQIYGTNKSRTLDCAQNSIDRFMENMTKKNKMQKRSDRSRSP